MKYLLQEFEVWYVIPALRKELALELRRQNVKQVETAKLLGVSKAAITQYINKSRAGKFGFDMKIKNEIKQSARRIKDGEHYVKEIQKLLGMVRNERLICKIHNKIEKMPKECGICFEK